MTQSGDPRDLERAEETAAASDAPESTVGDDVEGDARLEEEQATDQNPGPGSLGGDNGGA